MKKKISEAWKKRAYTQLSNKHILRQCIECYRPAMYNPDKGIRNRRCWKCNRQYTHNEYLKKRKEILESSKWTTFFRKEIISRTTLPDMQELTEHQEIILQYLKWIEDEMFNFEICSVELNSEDSPV